MDGQACVKTATTSCDIYRREIDDLVSSGDEEKLAEMIQTWYTRCEFKTAPDGGQIKEVGVRDNGIVWFRTTRGMLEFCQHRKRWRLLERGGEPIYMMARIAEVTQVPFAYLCGVRDAIAVTESRESEEISDRLKSLKHEGRLLSEEIRRKLIAIDAVAVSVDATHPSSGVSSARYPDAPAAVLTWSQVRKHYKTSSGVYFAWNDGRIVYVGATERGMQSRLASGHHAVTNKDMFSFIEMPSNEVYFAEMCYIARYAPERNAPVAQANGKRQGGNRGKRKERRAAESAAAV